MGVRRKAETGHRLLDAYRDIAAARDEMVDPAGKLRPGWEMLVGWLDAMEPRERLERFGRADQYLRDAGVFYRVYEGEGAQERQWPLAHVPLVIQDAEWREIAAGIAERAEFLEHVVADIYGPTELVSKGLIPPSLIAGSPEYLRPLAGVTPHGGHYLHFCAFDLGRGPDGRWWVLGDRTQAPSGAGFALENRVAATRALPEPFAKLNVRRLAAFFRSFRDALTALSPDPDGKIAILTPGAFNETYFEHAWIARYLGIMLLEGQDLRVADGRVMVRTISGLQPVSVLWRRMDAGYMDPLELNGASRIGTPGFVEALRNRSVGVVNAAGSGILETRALLAFLPRIASQLTGSHLRLPSIATWWCGDQAACEDVIANLERRLIGPALAPGLAFEDADHSLHGGRLGVAERSALIDRLRHDGAAFVGQEAVNLSTMPVYTEGKLEPRPVTLRVFAARTRSGWTVMPGGLARVGRTRDPTAIAMQRGGQTADVWIASDMPARHESLLPAEGEAPRRYRTGSLPSRAAENLMWLGRYAERLEGSVRLLRAYHVRLTEGTATDLPLMTAIGDYLDLLDIDVSNPVGDSLLRTIDNATASAGRVRDRFSPDGWLALADLSKTLRRFADRVQPGDDAARATTIVLRKLAGFSGLVHENMYRFAGWRFLEIGRRLERGIHMSRLLGAFAGAARPIGALEMLLEVGDSVLTHRRQHSVNAGRATVVDLLALDPLNPRSIAFQLNRLKDEISQLPGSGSRPSAALKEILSLHTRLSAVEAREIGGKDFDALGTGLGDVSDLLSRSYFA